MIPEEKPWEEILTKSQMERVDDFDITILECIRRRAKRGEDKKVGTALVRKDVLNEYGFLAGVDFNERLEKLEDMGLLVRYVGLKGARANEG